MRPVHEVLQQAFALLAGDIEHTQERNEVTSHSAANAAAFGQAIENAKQLFVGQIQSLARLHRSRRKRAATMAAFEAPGYLRLLLE